MFRAKPDGTDMFVLYGAQSPGNSFLHPREMDPGGQVHAGFISSSLMSLSGTQEGGSLMFIDAANYSEQDNTPANSTVPAAGGGTEGGDAAGRWQWTGAACRCSAASPRPYPLWDGTNRVLVAYRALRGHEATVKVVPCTALTAGRARPA